MFSTLTSRLLKFQLQQPNVQVRRLSYLAVTPDPKHFEPIKPIVPGSKGVYFIKFGDGPKERVEKYATTNPNYTFAHNDGATRYGKPLEKEVLQKQLNLQNVSQNERKRSEWYKIEDLGLKDEQGRDLKAVLLVLLEKFPSFNFELEDERKKAEQEITALLTPVAKIVKTDERKSFESTGTNI